MTMCCFMFGERRKMVARAGTKMRDARKPSQVDCLVETAAQIPETNPLFAATLGCAECCGKTKAKRVIQRTTRRSKRLNSRVGYVHCTTADRLNADGI